MKKILLFIVLLPQLLLSQVPNNGFESWFVNNTEEPTGWITNNYNWYISVSKTSNCFSGAYAAQIISNAPGIEGPMPGWMKTTLIPDRLYDQLTLHYKCDSVLAPAYGEITVKQYINGIYTEIGNAVINEKNTSFEELNIALNCSQLADSLEITISANTADMTWYWSGFFSWTIDEVKLTNSSGFYKQLLKPPYLVYPNPANSGITVEILKKYNNEQITAEIVDVNHRIIKTCILTSNKSYLNLENIEAGVYFLIIPNETELTVNRILIK